MYKKFQLIEGMNKRIRLAGMAYLHELGYRSARQFCKQTVVGMADLDEDKMLFYSNDIDKDYEGIEEKVEEPFSGFWNLVAEAYIVPEQLEQYRYFMQPETLRRAFEQGQMSDSVEYLCIAGGERMWIRAIYELEQDENDHLIVSFALINVNTFREKIGLEI